jgi:hypothetical protein
MRLCAGCNARPRTPRTRGSPGLLEVVRLVEVRLVVHVAPPGRAAGTTESTQGTAGCARATARPLTSTASPGNRCPGAALFAPRSYQPRVSHRRLPEHRICFVVVVLQHQLQEPHVLAHHHFQALLLLLRTRHERVALWVKPDLIDRPVAPGQRACFTSNSALTASRTQSSSATSCSSVTAPLEREDAIPTSEIATSTVNVAPAVESNCLGQIAGSGSTSKVALYSWSVFAYAPNREETSLTSHSAANSSRLVDCSGGAVILPECTSSFNP